MAGCGARLQVVARYRLQSIECGTIRSRQKTEILLSQAQLWLLIEATTGSIVVRRQSAGGLECLWIPGYCFCLNRSDLDQLMADDVAASVGSSSAMWERHRENFVGSQYRYLIGSERHSLRGHFVAPLEPCS